MSTLNKRCSSSGQPVQEVADSGIHRWVGGVTSAKAGDSPGGDASYDSHTSLRAVHGATAVTLVHIFIIILFI